MESQLCVSPSLSHLSLWTLSHLPLNSLSLRYRLSLNSLFSKKNKNKNKNSLCTRAAVLSPSGANDASRSEGHKTHYGVPIPEYKRNLRWIAGRYAKGPEGPVVVVCTPPPIDEPRRLRLTTEIKGMPPALLDRSATRTERYAGAAAEVAAEMGVASADLHGGLKGHGGSDWATRLLSDGLHLTEEGQERVYQIIEDVVRNWKRKDVGDGDGEGVGEGEGEGEEEDATTATKKKGSEGGGESMGIGASSLRAHFAVLRWEAPGHAELAGVNNTDEWKPRVLAKGDGGREAPEGG